MWLARKEVKQTPLTFWWVKTKMSMIPFQLLPRLKTNSFSSQANISNHRASVRPSVGWRVKEQWSRISTLRGLINLMRESKTKPPVWRCSAHHRISAKISSRGSSSLISTSSRECYATRKMAREKALVKLRSIYHQARATGQQGHPPPSRLEETLKF